jgi:hypothetical protein
MPVAYHNCKRHINAYEDGGKYPRVAKNRFQSGHPIYQERVLDGDKVKKRHGKHKIDGMALTEIKPAPPVPRVSSLVKRHSFVSFRPRITLVYNGTNTIFYQYLLQ